MYTNLWLYRHPPPPGTLWKEAACSACLLLPLANGRITARRLTRAHGEVLWLDHTLFFAAKKKQEAAWNQNTCGTGKVKLSWVGSDVQCQRGQRWSISCFCGVECCVPSAGQVPSPRSPAELCSLALASEIKLAPKISGPDLGAEFLGASFSTSVNLEHVSLQKLGSRGGKKVCLLALNLCRAFFSP